MACKYYTQRMMPIVSFNVIKRCISQSHYFRNGTDTRVPQNLFLVIIIIIIITKMRDIQYRHGATLKSQW